MIAERDKLKYFVIISPSVTPATISIDYHDDVLVTLFNRITIAAIKGTASVGHFPRLKGYKDCISFYPRSIVTVDLKSILCY